MATWVSSKSARRAILVCKTVHISHEKESFCNGAKLCYVAMLGHILRLVAYTFPDAKYGRSKPSA